MFPDCFKRYHAEERGRARCGTFYSNKKLKQSDHHENCDLIYWYAAITTDPSAVLYGVNAIYADSGGESGGEGASKLQKADRTTSTGGQSTRRIQVLTVDKDADGKEVVHRENLKHQKHQKHVVIGQKSRLLRAFFFTRAWLQDAGRPAVYPEHSGGRGQRE